MSCGKCKHGLDQGHEEGVQCRRFPPSVVVLSGMVRSVEHPNGVMHNTVRGQWPQMPHDGWCGEFTAKEVLNG